MAIIIGNSKASEHILNQDWRGKMVDNMIEEGNTPDRILSFLLGNKGGSTVNYAFYWDSSPEGYDYWSNIDMELNETSASEDWGDFYVKINLG